MGNQLKGDKYKHIGDIKRNYQRMEEELVTQLNYEINNHHATAGGNREEIWKSFFKRIIPKKFNIARSVFIIDSKGKCSKEVDIAIYDEQYTPYIFNYGLIKFIPVEAVAAVVQCKSKTLDSSNLKEWAESIKNLETSTNSIARLATKVHVGTDENSSTQTATKPIKILCYISDEESDGDEKKSFDIVIEACSKTKDKNRKNKMKILFEDENLLQVLEKYNSPSDNIIEEVNDKLEGLTIEKYEIKDKNKEKYSLLSFIFQFNQMLMMINNPMFFPHISYAEMFNNHVEEDSNI